MVPFYKLSGAGNDFLALVEPESLPAADDIRAWCRRGHSLGADGLVVLSRQGESVRMRYWNADGTRGALCLNGSRSSAQLVFHLGWPQADSVRIETDSGELEAWQIDTLTVRIRLPHGSVGEPRAQGLEVAGQVYNGTFVMVGVPHYVLPWEESLETVPIGELGPALRAHPDLGTAGANVDFVRFLGPERFQIRSYERGVEEETLACGTGAVATVAVTRSSGDLRVSAIAETVGGFDLKVEGGEDDPAAWTLTGDARVIARGEIFPA